MILVPLNAFEFICNLKIISFYTSAHTRKSLVISKIILYSLYCIMILVPLNAFKFICSLEIISFYTFTHSQKSLVISRIILYILYCTIILVFLNAFKFICNVEIISCFTFTHTQYKIQKHESLQTIYTYTSNHSSIPTTHFQHLIIMNNGIMYLEHLICHYVQ